jgi:hypothetical protein
VIPAAVDDPYFKLMATILKAGQLMGDTRFQRLLRERCLQPRRPAFTERAVAKADARTYAAKPGCLDQLRGANSDLNRSLRVEPEQKDLCQDRGLAKPAHRRRASVSLSRRHRDRPDPGANASTGIESFHKRTFRRLTWAA